MKDMKRVLLKLSGEALAGEKKNGFDEETVTNVAKQIKTLVTQGYEIGIIIGGGNFWRGRTSEKIDRTKADAIGMLATVMNCIYVSEIFRTEGMETEILTPFECGSFTKLFSKDRAVKYLKRGQVVFFAGGIGHPKNMIKFLFRRLWIKSLELLIWQRLYFVWKIRCLCVYLD